MDQDFEDEIDRDLLENGPGEPPFIRLAKAEQRVRELTATTRQLEAALAEALEDSKRRRVALEEVLDGLGALTKPHELDGCGIGIKRALEIIALSKERP